ncbi:acyltransferase family protein [Ferrovibrio terrae]|uniref:acyltransferase family protein n=1 Tax=Ferrovibrio terrae TaxID=2594003 RepID=UPI003137AF61
MSETGLHKDARRYDLDWLRIIAFGLLIFYHIGMFFVAWPWHVKSSHAGPEIQPLMLLTSPWRLALLFLIAGCATRFMADRMTRGRMARQRSWRLLPPLVFGMLVIVPPQTYAEIVEKLGYSEGVFAFYAKYISFHGGWRVDGRPLIVPTWNHLWFVAYLWVYTMIVIALRPLLHALPLRGVAVALRQPMALLLVPPLLIGALRLVLRPVFGETHALVDDWYLHALYLSLFLFGYGIARQEGIWLSLERLRWLALALAVTMYAVMVLVVLTDTGGRMRPFIWALDQWAWIVMLLGFARRHLNVDTPLRRYLTDAIFPFYILHQTIIVMLGHRISGLGLSAGSEAALLAGATMAGCWAGYEAVRRVGWLRPLFGLRRAVQPA